MKQPLIILALFLAVFFGFAFLLDSALERDSAFRDNNQAFFECRESGLSLKECNFN